MMNPEFIDKVKDSLIPPESSASQITPTGDALALADEPAPHPVTDYTTAASEVNLASTVAADKDAVQVSVEPAAVIEHHMAEQNGFMLSPGGVDPIEHQLLTTMESNVPRADDIVLASAVATPDPHERLKSIQSASAELNSMLKDMQRQRKDYPTLHGRTVRLKKRTSKTRTKK